MPTKRLLKRTLSAPEAAGLGRPSAPLNTPALARVQHLAALFYEAAHFYVHLYLARDGVLHLTGDQLIER